MYNKRLIVDFDDTIAFTKNRDWENAKPNIDLIKKLNELSSCGWTVDIFTARGSLSCSSREEADKTYRPQIEKWLEKNNVNYTMLSFDKPLGAYYIDDKGITPEDFVSTNIRQLEGGLSGSDIYTDGLLVHKTDKNSHLVHAWFNYADRPGLNVPRVERVVGETITMEYIPHDENYFMNSPYKALGIIQETIDAMRDTSPLETDYVFNDYINRIENHATLSNQPEFMKIAKTLEYLDLNPTFFHGDFGIKNMLFHDEELYLIDPIPNVFGCIELDIAKFIASLVINEYDSKYVHLAFKTLTLFNDIHSFHMDVLVRAEILRVYKYHPNKSVVDAMILDTELY